MWRGDPATSAAERRDVEVVEVVVGVVAAQTDRRALARAHQNRVGAIHHAEDRLPVADEAERDRAVGVLLEGATHGVPDAQLRSDLLLRKDRVGVLAAELLLD